MHFSFACLFIVVVGVNCFELMSSYAVRLFGSTTRASAEG